jgi:hypothetical protein
MTNASIPLVRIDAVIHVGSLKPCDRTTRSSLEGPCLSVSLDPEAWGAIARVAGPHWLFERPGALWLDACALDDAQRRAIADWAVDAGFAARTTAWRAWSWDGKSDDWRYSLHDSEGEAADEADDPDDLGLAPDEMQAPSETGAPVEPVQVLRLTDAGMDRLECWHDPRLGEDGAAILWAMEVGAAQTPDLVGIWWNEFDDPLSLSCPRGGILPARLGQFDVSGPLGRRPPEAFFRAQGPAGVADMPER